MKHKDSQAGNAFFLILLGVALLVAFTLAVTRSSSVDTGATAETDRIAATRIIAYGNTLKSAVDLLRTNGISETDITFANSTISGYGTVGANPSAEVFNSAGGGISYEAPEAKWLNGVNTAQDGYGEWRFTGANAVRLVGTPQSNNSSVYCQAANCAELVAVLAYVKKSVCQQINTALNFKNSTTAIPTDAVSFYLNKYAGVFLASPPHISEGSTSATWGKLQGCIEGGGSGPASGTYHYFQVLIAR